MATRPHPFPGGDPRRLATGAEVGGPANALERERDPPGEIDPTDAVTSAQDPPHFGDTGARPVLYPSSSASLRFIHAR